jgi:tRNA-dihydrouridine synthase B
VNAVDRSGDCLMLAPMRGLTGNIYRDVFARRFGGIDRAMAPFIATVKPDKIKPSLMRDIDPECNPSLPVIPQLIGNDPDDFLAMAEVVAALGHEELNWNLGCPWPMVVKRKRGSGVLAHPELIEAMLDRVAGHARYRLSLKVRLGVGRADQLLELVPLINRYPLSEVIIHPRTASQMYAGTPDLDMFARCLETITHPVVYNGDINSVADFKRLSERFPSVRRWMIGRGLLVDPFLALAIRGDHSAGDGDVARIRSFLDELYDCYREQLSGPGPVLGRMKELWVYQSQWFVDGPRNTKKIQRSQTLAQYERAVDAFFAGRS